jgi:IS30 family transposase
LYEKNSQKFSHLSKSDRNEIKILLDKKYSQRDIALSLGRSNSTISDEIKRGSVRGTYEPLKAHHKAYVRRWQSKYQAMKIVEDAELRNFVEKKLLKDDSPTNISGRIKKHEKHLSNISKSSIYRYIKSPYGRRIENHRNKRKQRRRNHRPKSEKLKDRTFIAQRPKYIARRKRIGDAEADFIVSGKSGKGVLLVVADRKSRTPFLEKILPTTIVEVEKAFLRIKERFPELKTLTLDNDILFRHHRRLEKLLNTKIYFCNPYHSWEKGTVEKVNREIRKDIPKGSNISKYSRQFIRSIEEKLQNKIYKVLNYHTPSEVLNKHRKRKNTSNSNESGCSV